MFKLFDRKQINEAKKSYQELQSIRMKVVANMQTLGDKLDALVSELENGHKHDAEIEKIKSLKAALQTLCPILCGDSKYPNMTYPTVIMNQKLDNVFAAYEACKDKLSDGLAASFWQLLAAVVSWFSKDSEWATGIKVWAEENAKLYLGFEKLQNLDFSVKSNLQPIKNQDDADDYVYAYLNLENKNEFHKELNDIFPSVTPGM